jgi:protein-disulfide isomerase
MFRFGTIFLRENYIRQFSIYPVKYGNKHQGDSSMAEQTNWGEVVRTHFQTGLLIVAALVIGFLFSEVRNLKSGGAKTQPTTQADGTNTFPEAVTVELASIVEQAGANPEQVKTCMDNGEYTSAITAEAQAGETAGVTGTPGNFVMVGTQGEALAGALPYESLKPILDEYIASGKTANTTDLSIVPAVTDQDHTRGAADAKVTVVVYSDYDCPFCSRFHETMLQVLEEYDGEVRMVLRDYPIPQLHPQAPAIAEAAECIFAQNGEEAYWSFTDQYFATKAGGAEVIL